MGREAVPPVGLREVLREDLANYRWVPGWRGAVLSMLLPGFQVTALHRFGIWSRGRRGPARTACRATYQVGYHVARNVYGIELPTSVQLGRRVRIAHQSGIVIHPGTVIGDDCVIRQNVSLGAARGDAIRFDSQAPRLGRGVSCGAGAVVIGGVTIGDGAILGPNVVVMTNIPAGAWVLPPPPRIMRMPSAVAAREEPLGGR